MSVKLYSLEYKEAKTYLTAALFIAGNILLPQLCHLVHFWGHTRLPIYFFALIGACKYGWRGGTVLVSPVVNSLWFGMPVITVLPAILIKSVLLAGIAGYVAARFGFIPVATTAASNRNENIS